MECIFRKIWKSGKKLTYLSKSDSKKKKFDKKNKTCQKK